MKRDIELEEPFFVTDRARLHQLLPWLYLFRAFGIAIRGQNLLLALAALLALSGGRWLISWAPFSEHARGTDTGRISVEDPRTFWPWQYQFLDHPLPRARDVSFLDAVTQPLQTVRESLSWGKVLFSPMTDLLDPGVQLFQRRQTWSALAEQWTEFLLALAVVCLFGGAISRSVALTFSGHGESGLKETLRFTIENFRFRFGAAAIPFFGVGCLFLLGRAIAWLGRVPHFGESILGLLWGVVLFLGLLMTLIILGIAVAWPLMIAAQSTEGTDGFDALSRGYSYLFSRPWYALGLALMTFFYGSVLIYFLTGVVHMTWHFSEWMAAGPIDDAQLLEVTRGGPDSSAGLPRQSTGKPATFSSWELFWLGCVMTLLKAFIYSFFWTTITIMYFLLRKSVDATPLEQVFLPRKPGPEDIPLSGIPASERREAKRAGPTDSPSQTEEPKSP